MFSQAATVVNDTEIRSLIIQGLTQQYGAAKSFGSLEAAMDVKCGADLQKLVEFHHLSDEFRRDDDLFLDYFDVAVDRFQTLVAEYSQAEAVIAPGSVLRTCLQLLNSTLRDDTSDCDELCTQLEMAVHRMSLPGLTREVNLESARMKRERTWLALSAKQSKLLDCMARRTELAAAKDQLESLDSAAFAAWKMEKTFKRRVFRVTRVLASHRAELKQQETTEMPHVIIAMREELNALALSLHARRMGITVLAEVTTVEALTELLLTAQKCNLHKPLLVFLEDSDFERTIHGTRVFCRPPYMVKIAVRGSKCHHCDCWNPAQGFEGFQLVLQRCATWWDEVCAAGTWCLPSSRTF
eukprot:s315_g13.t3